LLFGAPQKLREIIEVFALEPVRRPGGSILQRGRRNIE